MLLQFGGYFLMAVEASKFRRPYRNFVTFCAVGWTAQTLMRTRQRSWRYLGMRPGLQGKIDVKDHELQREAGRDPRAVRRTMAPAVRDRVPAN